MSTDDLKNADSYFNLSKNWASYAKFIGEAEIGEAKRGFRKLVPAEDLASEYFLHIGCGCDLHALVAAQLDGNRVLAADIDALAASAPVDWSRVRVFVPMLAEAGFKILWRQNPRLFRQLADNIHYIHATYR